MESVMHDNYPETSLRVDELALAPVEHIVGNGQALCYILRSSFQPDRPTFPTPPEFTLQVGYIVYPEGHQIERHYHPSVERHLTTTSEVLVVRKGSCEIDIYDDRQEPVATRLLRVGDVAIIVAGGHGFRMLEDTVLLEIKQGPFSGGVQKETF
jgi:hypothetical protein